MTKKTSFSLKDSLPFILFFLFLGGNIFVIQSQLSQHFIIVGYLQSCPGILPKHLLFHNVRIGHAVRCERNTRQATVYLSISNSFRERLPSSSYIVQGKDPNEWKLIVVNPLSPPLKPFDSIRIRNRKEAQHLQMLTKMSELIIHGYHNRFITSESELVQSLEKSEPFQYLMRHSERLFSLQNKMLPAERERWKNACQTLTRSEFTKTRKGKKFINTLFTILECGPLKAQGALYSGPIGAR